jgi:hypothetical protein
MPEHLLPSPSFPLIQISIQLQQYSKSLSVMGVAFSKTPAKSKIAVCKVYNSPGLNDAKSPANPHTEVRFDQLEAW